MFIRPTLRLPSVLSLQAETLDAWGVRGLLLDLDNTLMPPHSGCYSPEILAWLHQMTRHGIVLYILTNNPNEAYVQAAAAQCGAGALTAARKPSQKSFQRALGAMNLPPSQVAMVGDQVIADILGGQWAGTFTVLVEPLTRKTENGFIRLCRTVERCLLQPTG
ncbi:MAG: YqeG family HAD IIIA-type phosphatase [Candidatus Melainabacteria bacterium]|nr:YqeG family HAD IIIA-type phosphatase [Candidatus Melainabacteria bacterium]